MKIEQTFKILKIHRMPADGSQVPSRGEVLKAMKRLGTSQVCSLQFYVPHDRIDWSLWID